eukprot:m.26134 g.26134  ORF g.26134 m.26134 type:complete len:250 (-) comp7770_c0_seq3:131-880(-)
MDSKHPIDLYFAATPNGWKISIMLEELGVEYNVIPVNLAKGEQFHEDFLAISPNNRIPAIVDHHPTFSNIGGPISVFESGAILKYLGEQFGRFYPPATDIRGRVAVDQWLFWQIGGLGPMAGQLSHFINYAPSLAPDTNHEYSLERYRSEYLRLFQVMDNQLEKTEYLAGTQYSIADIASWPWIVPYKRFLGDDGMAAYPNLRRWFVAIKNRPAVKRGMNIMKEQAKKPLIESLNSESRSILFPNKSKL